MIGGNEEQGHQQHAPLNILPTYLSTRHLSSLCTCFLRSSGMSSKAQAHSRGGGSVGGSSIICFLRGGWVQVSDECDYNKAVHMVNEMQCAWYRCMSFLSWPKRREFDFE